MLLQVQPDQAARLHADRGVCGEGLCNGRLQPAGDRGITNDTIAGNEDWKPIPGWAGLYEVSAEGQVRSLARRDRLGRHWCGRLLRPALDQSTGYLKVNLHHDEVKRHAYVHHLVAETFLGPRPHGHEINHIDGDKTNNRLTNLEYLLKAENVRHAYRTGLNRGRSRFGSTNPNAKLDESVARLIRGTIGCVTGVALARALGISTTTISRIRTGQGWCHIQTQEAAAA